MRLVFVSLIAAASLVGTTACSGEAAPGSPEWCKNTPLEKQVEDPTAMGKCLEQATS